MKETERVKIEAKIPKSDSPINPNLRGRLAWTLFEFVKAGDNGITPLDNPVTLEQMENCR